METISLQSTPRLSSLAPKNAFTLLEVIVAMVILSILAGSLYVLVKTSIQSSVVLERAIRRQQEITGLIDLCQLTFRNLPMGAIFEGTSRLEGGSQVKAVIIRNSFTTFTWGNAVNESGVSILSARAQNNGLLSVSLSHSKDFEGGESKWLQLVSNLKDFQLKFYDSRSGAWSEEWKDPSFRPSLIEMQLKLSEGDQSYRHVFALPAVAPFIGN